LTLFWDEPGANARWVKNHATGRHGRGCSSLRHNGCYKEKSATAKVGREERAHSNTGPGGGVNKIRVQRRGNASHKKREKQEGRYVAPLFDGRSSNY